MFKKRPKGPKSNVSSHRKYLESLQTDNLSNSSKIGSQLENNPAVQQAVDQISSHCVQLEHPKIEHLNSEDLDIDENWEDEQLRKNGVTLTRNFMNSEDSLEALKRRIEQQIKALESELDNLQ